VLWVALTGEKQDFSRRLREALKKAEAPGEGAASIAREFNLRYEGRPVTAQAVGKWLAGRALPSQDKIRALSLWLEVSPHWLRFGDGDAKSAPVLRQPAATYRVDPQWLAKKYEALNEPHKKVVVEILIALLKLEGKR
jgi:transcriptional regulator with XRE-family HTH domain